MSSLLRVGIIGTGNHGSRYANHILNDFADTICLKAISRRSTQVTKQAANWNCTSYQDWHKLITDPEVDAVISVTPPTLNYDIAKTCAEAGKPLLIEKPLAANEAQAQKIVSIFKEENLGLTVAQTLRYNSIINSLRTELHTVGNIYSFCATHRLEPSTLSWLESPSIAGGGVIFHTAVHVFDALRYITGLEILRVNATGKKIHNPNLEDLFTAQIELSNGSIGIVEASKVGTARSGRYEFVGENGLLQGDQIHDVLDFTKGAKTKHLSKPKPCPSIAPLLRDWHLFLTESRKNPIPGEAGLAAVKICEACRISMEKNCWVTL